jgi:hypothetical protein
LSEEHFISHWENLLVNELRIFPDDFIPVDKFRILKLPASTLIMSDEFFGNYEILSVNGTSILQTENIYFAKYIIYSNRERANNIKVPSNDKIIKASVIEYEKYLNDIIKRIESDFKIHFPGNKNYSSAVNTIFRKLNLVKY